jgi:hypothetical protein
MFAQEVSNSVDQTSHDFAAPRDRWIEIHLLYFDGETKLAGMMKKLQEFGAPEKGLTGDAAPIEADAANRFPLNERCLQFQLGRAYRGDIAAGPAPNDYKIKLGHWLPGLPDLSKPPLSV